MSDETPKLHIDSDWKAEARAEKDRLAAQAEAKGPARKGEDELPEPDFRSLVGILAHQAVMGLGAMADPKSGRVIVDLVGARFSIDLLDVLDQKTKGNLLPEEADDLKNVLAELRSRYVQIAQLVAKQQAAQGAGIVGAEGLGSGPSIIQP